MRPEVSPSHAQYLRQLDRRRLQVRVLRLLILVAALGLWELAAGRGWIDAFIFSSPSRLCATLAEMLAHQHLLRHIGYTLGETLLSFFISTLAGILLAMLLNELRSSEYKKVVQSVSYLPHFISTVVVCGMVVNFLANSGPINDVIEKLGGTRIQFMMEAKYFRTIYIATGIWQNIGWNSIIYFAAISGVDPSLYEAALMDGAGRFKQAIHVTLPAILPTITIMLIMAIGNLLSVGYEKIILLYNGSTYETADVISTYVYRKGIQGADYSYSTAVGLFQSVIGLIFIWGANKFSALVTEPSLW